MQTVKFEWFDEEVGDGPYKVRTCGYRFDITDSPNREAYIRNAECEAKMMEDALSSRLFGDDDEARNANDAAQNLEIIDGVRQPSGAKAFLVAWIGDGNITYCDYHAVPGSPKFEGFPHSLWGFFSTRDAAVEAVRRAGLLDKLKGAPVDAPQA